MQKIENCPYRTESCFLKNGEDFSGRLIVVKFGSSTITQGGDIPNQAFMDDTARQASCLFRHGAGVMLVSSGAVASGTLRFQSLVEKEEKETRKQLMAAKGQPIKFFQWIQAFNRYDIDVFQFLFSDADLKKKRTLNSLRASVKYGVVDINGNDPVNISELRRLKIKPSESGDNDHMAASVTLATQADTLINVTDKAGVLDKDQKVIPYIDADTPLDTLSFFETSKPGVWIGGMASKVREGLRAAIGSKNSDCKVFISDDKEEDFILRIASGERIGTMICRQAPILVGVK